MTLSEQLKYFTHVPAERREKERELVIISSALAFLNANHVESDHFCRLHLYFNPLFMLKFDAQMGALDFFFINSLR